jgi:hypothetical protein
MGDMAFVSQCVLSCRRLFDLSQLWWWFRDDERWQRRRRYMDSPRIKHVVRTLRHVSVACVLYVTVYSISGVVGHIPYVVPPLIAIMGKKSPLVPFRDFCRERVLERLRMGANRKDLFYHLVSSGTQDLCAFISRSVMTEWRGTP